MNEPPTAVGGISEPRGGSWFSSVDMNEPPTAVGGIGERRGGQLV
jgi:hypothetical protein